MQTLSGKEISKIGIGSYGIGGRGHRDMLITEKDSDEKYIDALIYTLQKGINFTEISLGYGHGQALELFKRALDKSNIDRRDLFLTHSLYPRDLATTDIIDKDVSSFYKIMDTDYTDSVLVTQSLILKFGENYIYSLLNKLLQTKKTRFISLSNAGIETINNFKKEFGDKFIAHEGHLSFEVRALQEKGILGICDNLSVKNIIWRPLRRGKTLDHNWPLLIELANKYNKTQSQIILNWMCKLGYYPMVLSIDKEHIDDNIKSTDFVMSDSDYQQISDFRPANYNPPEVDWDGLGIDASIVELANNFEEHLNHREGNKDIR